MTSTSSHLILDTLDKRLAQGDPVPWGQTLSQVQDIGGYHNWGLGDAPGIEWVGASDAAQQPAVPGMDPTIE